MEQLTVSKLQKQQDKAIYCHLAYLTYMQSTSCEIPWLEESQADIKIAGRNCQNQKADDKILKHHPILSPPISQRKVHELIIHSETLTSNIVFKNSFLVVQQKSTQHCKAIIFQIKTKKEKKRNKQKKLFPESHWGFESFECYLPTLLTWSCNKCCTFLHHNPVSIDWLYCMSADWTSVQFSNIGKGKYILTKVQQKIEQKCWASQHRYQLSPVVTVEVAEFRRLLLTHRSVTLEQKSMFLHQNPWK